MRVDIATPTVADVIFEPCKASEIGKSPIDFKVRWEEEPPGVGCGLDLVCIMTGLDWIWATVTPCEKEYVHVGSTF